MIWTEFVNIKYKDSVILWNVEVLVTEADQRGAHSFDLKKTLNIYLNGDIISVEVYNIVAVFILSFLVFWRWAKDKKLVSNAPTVKLWFQGFLVDNSTCFVPDLKQIATIPLSIEYLN